MTRLILKFLLIFKTLEATFKLVQIKAEGGAGRPLGRGGISTKIWLRSFNALGRRREGRMQRFLTNSETIIKI